jgi:hypothetical protein
MTTTHSADVTAVIKGVDPRLTIRRHQTGIDMWVCDELDADGNYKPARPEYVYILQVDGIMVDSSARKTALVLAARSNGADYIAEVDAR